MTDYYGLYVRCSIAKNTVKASGSSGTIQSEDEWVLAGAYPPAVEDFPFVESISLAYGFSQSFEITVNLSIPFRSVHEILSHPMLKWDAFNRVRLSWGYARSGKDKSWLFGESPRYEAMVFQRPSISGSPEVSVSLKAHGVLWPVNQFRVTQARTDNAASAADQIAEGLAARGFAVKVEGQSAESGGAAVSSEAVATPTTGGALSAVLEVLNAAEMSRGVEGYGSQVYDTGTVAEDGTFILKLWDRGSAALDSHRPACMFRYSGLVDPRAGVLPVLGFEWPDNPLQFMTRAVASDLDMDSKQPFEVQSESASSAPPPAAISPEGSATATLPTVPGVNAAASESLGTRLFAANAVDGQARGDAITSEVAATMLAITITTLAIPNIQPGMIVLLDSFGDVIDGLYFVSRVETTISDAGETTLQLNRTAYNDGPSVSAFATEFDARIDLLYSNTSSVAPVDESVVGVTSEWGA